MTDDFTILARGAFSLRESAEFGFGQRDRAVFDAKLRLAFVLDGYDTQVGAVVRQAGDTVHGEVHHPESRPGRIPVATVSAQVARMLSLDHDGTAFAEIGRRDPVIARLQAVAPGLRPPLFHSPYEAAAWSVLSARRPARQMAAVRDRLSAEHGHRFRLAGRDVAAFPTPAQLLEVADVPGLPREHLSRLHGVARAALSGSLDVLRLQRMGPDAAVKTLRQIRGIGPFYAGLITVRATGFADVLPVDEPNLRARVGELYGFDGPVSGAELERIAEAWRPLRTWAAVLIRAAAGRLSDQAAPAIPSTGGGA
ncbi:MAG: DNA-3-methyladenine glycosylase 2 family protein [Actinomycetota bacterium]|nr:DNA-3-methyladenine glycosylase 2 family protein [Actinomycetota bacterium]